MTKKNKNPNPYLESLSKQYDLALNSKELHTAVEKILNTYPEMTLSAEEIINLADKAYTFNSRKQRPDEIDRRSFRFALEYALEGQPQTKGIKEVLLKTIKFLSKTYQEKYLKEISRQAAHFEKDELRTAQPQKEQGELFEPPTR